MKRKVSVILIICMLACVFFTQASYAKYIMNGQLSMSVYIDKTPPTISVVSNGTTDNFNKSKTDLVKRTADVTINTSDNIKIKYNEYYYNPTSNNFDGKTATRFNNGKTFSAEGYYKIVAVDTSGNKTEIVILLDKSAPNVTVKFFKKGEVSLLRVNQITGLGGVLS